MNLRTGPDEIDLEQLHETCESPGYGLIAERIAQARKDASRKLEVAGTWEEALKLQGEVAALDEVAAMPKRIAFVIAQRSQKQKRSNTL
jgi:hypothetical protein